MIGPDRRPVEAVDRYLAWLTNTEKSPNTIRAYACDLKKFVTFLATRDVRWDRVSLEMLGEFAAWLRSPAENVIVLEHGTPARAASSVNRTLSAVFGFYEFHARGGVPLARELVARGRSGYGSYKPFLHGIATPGPRGCGGRLHRLRVSPPMGSCDGACVVRVARLAVAGGGVPGDRRVGCSCQTAAGAAGVLGAGLSAFDGLVGPLRGTSRTA